MNLHLELLAGYRGLSLVALSGGRVAYPVATCVAVSTVAGQTEWWTPGDGLHEVCAIACNRAQTLMVCAERQLKVPLLVCSWPDRKVLQRIPNVASLGVVDMAFSRDGKVFAVLSDAPAFNITLFSVDFQNKFALLHQQKTPNLHHYTHVSFCPRDSHLLCTSGGGHLALWTVDPQTNALHAPNEGRVQMTGVRLTAHVWLPTGEMVCGSLDGTLFSFDRKTVVGRVMFDADDDAGAVVALCTTKLHLVAAHAGGLVRFIAHDGRAIDKTARLGSRSLTTLVPTPEWHTFIAGGSDGTVEALHLPGYENCKLPQEEFAMLAPKASVVAGLPSSAAVGVVHHPEAHAVGIVWENSIFGVFDYASNSLLARTHLGVTPPTAVEGGRHSSKQQCVVGHADGVVRVVRIATGLVDFRAKVFTTSVQFVVVNDAGDLCVASDGASIAFIQLVPTPEVVCTVSLGQSTLQHVAWVGQFGLLLAYKSGELQHINAPDSVSIEEDTMSAPLDLLLVNIWKLDFPVVRLLSPVVFDDAFHVFALSMDKETKLYVIDRTLPADRKDRDTRPCKPQFSVRDHDKHGSSVQLLRNQWLLTTGTDGRLVARDVAGYLQHSAPLPKDVRRDAVTHTERHVSLHGGARGAAIAPDQSRVVTVGGDGAVAVWLVSGAGAKAQRFQQQPFDDAAVGDAAELTPDAAEPMMYREKLSERAQQLDLMQHEPHRKSVMDAIARLRVRLEAIRAENEAAAPEEQVDLKDFLVQRQQQAFVEECDRAIAEMRERIRWENVNRDFVIETIKRECWDTMMTKLTPLESLSTKDLVVHNFHLRREENADLLLLEKLKFMRRVQEVDRAKRGVRELEDIQEEPAAGDDVGSPAAGQVSAPSGAATVFEAEGEQKLPGMEERARADVAEFLYRPMLVFTRNRAIVQNRLLTGRIRHIKHEFNIEFDALVDRKKADIQRIEERNVRCRQVQKELENTQPLFTPAMSLREDPANVLSVRDDEVAADKTTDPQEKARLAQEAADAQRWRERYGTDDSSERALRAWMDGRLEKEIRVLEVKVDRPDFADETSDKFVPVDERSDEQNKIYADYEKRLARRIEEVNARRKSLQAELANLQKDNKETAAAFDKSLVALLTRRLSAASRCFEVELQQIKLVQSVVMQQERAKISAKMEEQRSVLEDKARIARHAFELANKELQQRQERLHHLAEEEKRRHKDLRSIHPFDSDDYGELLHKLYLKRKPKKDRPGGGAGAGAAGLFGGRREVEKKASKMRLDVDTSMDPFSTLEREEEARRRQKAAEDAAPLPRIDRPEGVPDALWEAFQAFRQDRLDVELEIHHREEDIAGRAKEVQALEQEMHETEEAAAEGIRRASAFHLESLREQYDLDELHVFRQGQVEVEQAPVVTDYADAVLIHRSRIERLNALIRASGREKVDRLREINAKRKDIRLVEWEIEHLLFCMQNLEMEYRHLHTLRVTKQMQEFINGGGDDHNEVQRVKLLRKIEHVQQSMTQKIQERQAQMIRLRRMIKDKELENQVLLGHVGDAKSTVDDRRSIRDLQSSELDAERTDRLMRDMRVTRKLEDVAKAQQEEMVALKKEIDRLRARTFPSFAVVSKRVVGNPDELA